MTVDITLTNGVAFGAEGKVSILEAAAHAAISLPFSCKTGRCSTCKCKVVSGETDLLYPETGITDQEKSEGWILSCVRSAKTDLILEVDDLGGLTLPPIKTLPCRISHLERLAPDVLQVKLRLPPTAEFSFMPGQYIDVIGHSGLRRSYSLASAGSAKKLLELHIRAVDGGAMSDYWFNQAGINDLLRLNGPLGTFFLRNIVDVDLIFLATGTGFAPIKAMLEALANAPSEQRPRSITVLWGGRVREDLYFDMSSICTEYTYIPVLTRAGSEWAGARGYIQEVLLFMGTDLSNAAVYACGSDAMTRSAKELLVKNGLPPKRYYSDAFVCSSS